MPLEIERKFLVSGTGWQGRNPQRLTQGYLNRDKHRTVRVRSNGKHGYLTIKGITTGAVRCEFEYEIPFADAKQLLALCEGPLIDKLRHKVRFEDAEWDIDEFLGENSGLIVAEIELRSESQPFARPPWLGDEVTHDPRYFNSNLTALPYASWPVRRGQR